MLKENMFFELEVTNADLIRSVLRQNSGGIAAKGVEISCKGDMVVLGFRKYRAINVCANHPIWDTFNILSEAKMCSKMCSKMIGTPLRIRRIYPDARFAGRGFAMMDNDEARYLDVEIDGSNPCWGMPDSGYTGKNGTGKVFGRVLVIREDMKDVTPKQVEAIVNFFSQDVSPKINEEIGLARLSGEEAGTELGKFMAELISRAKIDSFFENFKA